MQAARDDSRTTGKVGSVGGSAGATHTVWTAATGTPGQDRLDVGVCLSGAYDFTDFRPDRYLAAFIQAVTNYVGVAQRDTTALHAASPRWSVDGTVAPLSLFDSVGDLMPAVQLDDMAAQLKAVGARKYQAATVSGNGHSFDYWPQVKNSALAFLGSVLKRAPTVCVLSGCRR